MKMRHIIGIAAFIFLGSTLAFFWHLQHSFSFAIRMKANHACKNVRPCTFKLAEIFPGDWDRVVIFDMAADQNEIDRTVGKGLKRPDLERLIVFMQGTQAVRVLGETQGVEHPEGHEVGFDRVPTEQNHIIIERAWRFVMTKGAVGCESCMTLVYIRPGESVQ